MDLVVPAIDVAEENSRLAETLQRERKRLRSFIRADVGELEDVEDILQDVFCELVEAVSLDSPVASPQGVALFEDLLPSPVADPRRHTRVQFWSMN